MQYDRNFLSKLDSQKNKIIFARITKLTFDELPIEQIEGQVTGGSINIDGQSAVRRTCSLSLLAQDYQVIDFYCGLNTKFKLEIGVKNEIDKELYPEIIWFNQGIYVITGFSTSRSASNYTISISGKDKMCLLNGEVGGSIESSVDFGVIEEEDIYGNWSIKKIPIKDIIRNAVHIYGKEPHHNIIINDLEDLGVELMEYRYDTPLYLYREEDLDVYSNVTFDGTTPCTYVQDEQVQESTFADLPTSIFEDLANLVSDTKKIIKLKNDINEDAEYYVTKIQYGETCGYRLTDLTYAGELIANAGETLTSILDKIKNMLVNFEYFYNVDGQFVFQKKPSVVSVMQNLDPTEKNKINTNLIFTDEIYSFNNGEILTSINNNPNLNNLKNDYSIWGERVSVSGAVIPIHLRYAIDSKPISYKTITVSKDEVLDYSNKYNVEVEGQTSKTFATGSYWNEVDTIQYCDWREVIYRMACDYYKYNFLEDFYEKVVAANGDLYPNGITGYESYYTDIYSFWRQNYYPIIEEVENLKDKKDMIEDMIENSNDTDEKISSAAASIDSIKEELIGKKGQIKACEKFIKAKRQAANDATGNTKKELRKELSEGEKYLAVLESQLKFLEEKRQRTIDKIENLELEQENYIPSNLEEDDINGNVAYRCWSKQVFSQPYLLNFWFDFLDTQGLLSQYKIKNIGRRQKVVKENEIKAISYNKIPNIIYHKKLDSIKEKAGYKHIQVGSHYDNMFTISGQGKSAKDRLNELMDIHSFCVENVTINSIPVYYLEPNSRIIISNSDLQISDIYLATKITLPLTYNGTMSISATKIYDSLN